MKKIKDLIKCDFDIEINGITDDSRLVEKNFLFVATRGFNVDHFDYIEDAISNGCSFIICDREINFSFPHLVVDKINEVFYDLCKKYYELDFNNFSFIGITGTDGKTTTTKIISELLGDCAYIGTNGLSINDKEFKTSNTTPCISELYKDLKLIQDSKLSNVAMEVSSEALLHDRVKDLKFDVVGFTNITGDHLNVHKTMNNYFECKLKLLDLLNSNSKVFVNGDDNYLCKIKCKNMYTFGFSNTNDYVITDVIYDKGNTIITLNDEIIINSPLHGKYNVYNVVMAFLICRSLEVSDDLLLERIKKLKPIDGRCEFLDFGQDFDIVLDYAHTINGIKSIIDSFKDYKKIITVTGCAGGREKEKRPIIGNYIMDNSDVSIFTMDDPRYEDVNDIIDEMVDGRNEFIKIVDRSDAINYALDIADSGSVVLILGKGRDNYMAIKDIKIEYNDYDVIRKHYEKD